MIVPASAIDDLGQEAEASITFLRYSLELAYRDSNDSLAPGALEIVKEELVHVAQRDAPRHLLFPHSAKDWRKSVVQGRRSARYFISTEGEGESRVIKLHQDGGSSGRPLRRPAANLPRTVLSVANAAESPTVLTARREMEAWQLVQLEPTAMRQPDEFVSPTHLGTDGRNLAATLYRLARNTAQYGHDGGGGDRGESLHAAAPNGEDVRVYSQITNRLGELIDDVHGIHIDLDERRELMTLYVKDRDGTAHPARALSDGTLRFLALSVLESDPKMQGVLCLEEPENGIHPERIPAILELLMDVAVDTQQPVGNDNPLRQVIVNTRRAATSAVLRLAATCAEAELHAMATCLWICRACNGSNSCVIPSSSFTISCVRQAVLVAAVLPASTVAHTDIGLPIGSVTSVPCTGCRRSRGWRRN